MKPDNGACPGNGTEPIDPAGLAFDIDGVIADTMSLFLDIARDEFGVRDVRYEHITSYSLDECLDMDPDVIHSVIVRLLNGTYRAALRPIAGAPEALSRIRTHSEPILFVTARPTPDLIRLWLHEVLPIEPEAIDVVATGTYDGKLDILKHRNISWFVEDRLETCFQIAEEGISPVLFRQPWNRRPHPFCEVGNWEELEALIDLP